MLAFPPTDFGTVIVIVLVRVPVISSNVARTDETSEYPAQSSDSTWSASVNWFPLVPALADSFALVLPFVTVPD